MTREEVLGRTLAAREEEIVNLRGIVMSLTDRCAGQSDHIASMAAKKSPLEKAAELEAKELNVTVVNQVFLARIRVLEAENDQLRNIIFDGDDALKKKVVGLTDLPGKLVAVLEDYEREEDEHFFADRCERLASEAKKLLAG